LVVCGRVKEVLAGGELGTVVRHWDGGAPAHVARKGAHREVRS
jgi:hypothetical protein